MRGAGTSIAGQRRRPRRRRRHQPAPEPGARRSTPRRGPPASQPGVVHAALQTRGRRRTGCASAPTRRTHTRCTVGGMIGNNACGSRSVAWGRTVDNVVGLDVLTGRGRAAVGSERRGAGRRPGRPLRRAGRRAARHGPHRLRPARPAGLRLLPRAPAARERARRGPGPGRHRGHAGAVLRGDGPAGRGAPPRGARRARLPRRWPTPPTPTPDCCRALTR